MAAVSIVVGRRLAALGLGLVLVLAACGSDDGASEPVAMEESDRTPPVDANEPREDIEGLVIVDDLSAGHERGDLDYDLNPPVGGDHNPFWQACGHYTVPVPEERVVHSLEHGAVWIAHLPETDVSSLEPLVGADEWLLMSPVEGLAGPIVLSAWGAQVVVDGPDDDRIQQFIDAYVRQGPEAAPCVRGGVGVPPVDVGPGLDV